MRRVFPRYTYGKGPRASCWWDQTVTASKWPCLDANLNVDVGIVGGGFTGVSAALTLAEAGVSVALLEANVLGWGASGRNGGFCCLGGGKISDSELIRRFGVGGQRDYRAAEVAAVRCVEDRLNRYQIDVDRHSEGETQLAHSPRAMAGMEQDAESVLEAYGVEPKVIAAKDLPEVGMGGPFHGAVTLPIGFALNPKKYLLGLVKVAEAAGARLFQHSAVLEVVKSGSSIALKSRSGAVRCSTVIMATNGYSSETIPSDMAGLYMPAQSTILVTRPLSDDDLAAQGWHSDQMAYDSRNLLHYFRLMPDRRFLFGTRGGLMSSPAAEMRARAKARRDFERMFPAWRHVETPNVWSGMVCLARNRTPFVGMLPGASGIYAAMAYHGNGVAMGSWAGAQVARLVLGTSTVQDLPEAIATPMRRFPLGRARRLMMPPAYAAMAVADLL